MVKISTLWNVTLRQTGGTRGTEQQYWNIFQEAVANQYIYKNNIFLKKRILHMQ